MLEFYYAPYSRSSAIHWILEELEVDYTPRLVDIRAPGGAPESYRQVHPHKKVPAIVHDGVTLTESAAIAIYLGDTFPKGDLAPTIGDPLRGPYLSWLVYLSTVFDPALTAKIKGWKYDSAETSFGVFEDVLKRLQTTLSTSAHALGSRLTLVDFTLANSLGWAMSTTELIPPSKHLVDYVARIQDRPSYQRFVQKAAG
jgi:glutathione S-transferase